MRAEPGRLPSTRTSASVPIERNVARFSETRMSTKIAVVMLLAVCLELLGYVTKFTCANDKFNWQVHLSEASTIPNAGSSFTILTVSRLTVMT